LVFETNFLQDVSAEEIGAVVDKVERVATRQALKGEIAVKQSQLALARQQFDTMTRDKARVADRYSRLAQEHTESGRKNPFKLPAQEAQHEETLNTSLATSRDMVERLEREIAQLIGLVDAGLQQAAE